MIRKDGKQFIPWAMAGCRILLGPVLIAGERCGWSGATLATVVVTALLSDIFDGVLARHWKCDTSAVRLFDSIADTGFYIAAAIALWSRQPGLWHDNALLLGAVVVAELANQGFSAAKFGKPASYHSYLAKAWGLVLAIAVVSAFGLGHSNPLMPAALLLGVFSNAEGIVMSSMLRTWHRDVKSLRAAWQLRAVDTRLSGGGQARQLATVVSAIAFAVFCLLPAPKALAADTTSATYAGGTAAIALQTAGSLDLTSPAALVFKPASSPGEIRIAYDAIRSFEKRDDVVRHLGVLPAIAAGLVAARQRHYTLTVSYADGAAVQVATFELSERDQRNLESVVRARAPKACSAQEYRPCPVPKTAERTATPAGTQTETMAMTVAHSAGPANTAQP